MKKFFVVSILCTSLSVQALPNTKDDPVPFLLRCELMMSALANAHVKVTAGLWSWMAYDSNFPIWRMTRKPGHYNTMAIQINEWAEIKAAGEGTFSPPHVVSAAPQACIASLFSYTMLEQNLKMKPESYFI